jgi:NAD(P)-dependent dehydrogenase (short-subunit alcohol dehydrogenase family)
MIDLRPAIGRNFVKRRSRPADISAAAGTLSSDLARFATGQDVRFDGGWVMA